MYVGKFKISVSSQKRNTYNAAKKIVIQFERFVYYNMLLIGMWCAHYEEKLQIPVKLTFLGQCMLGGMR